MAQTAVKQANDPNYLETLHDATRRYRLRDSAMSNSHLAERLGLQHENGDFSGLQNCCFFYRGVLVAIRTKQDEMSIFHVFQRFQQKMEQLGDRIE